MIFIGDLYEDKIILNYSKNIFIVVYYVDLIKNYFFFFVKKVLRGN